MTKRQFNNFLNKNEIEASIKDGNPDLHWLLYEDINQDWDSRDIIFEIIKLTKDK